MIRASGDVCLRRSLLARQPPRTNAILMLSPVDDPPFEVHRQREHADYLGGIAHEQTGGSLYKVSP